MRHVRKLQAPPRHPGEVDRSDTAPADGRAEVAEVLYDIGRVIAVLLTFAVVAELLAMALPAG